MKEQRRDNNMPEYEEILDLDAACDLLRIHHRTMYTLLKEGKVPAVKIGGQWRFSKKELLNMFTPVKPGADTTTKPESNSGSSQA